MRRIKPTTHRDLLIVFYDLLVLTTRVIWTNFSNSFMGEDFLIENWSTGPKYPKQLTINAKSTISIYTLIYFRVQQGTNV